MNPSESWVFVLWGLLGFAGLLWFAWGCLDHFPHYSVGEVLVFLEVVLFNAWSNSMQKSLIF